MEGYYVDDRYSMSEYVDQGRDAVNQEGGFLMTGLALYGTAKGLISKASDLYSGQKATMLKNVIGKQLTSNPNWRQSYPGEKHILLPTEYGLTMANYCGPGTNLTQRLQNKDPGVDGPNGVDEACKQHDIAVSKAKTKRQVKKADKQLINAVSKSKANRFVKTAIKSIVRAKNVAEDFGMYDSGLPDDISGNIPTDRTTNDAPKKKPLLPAQKLKQKILKKVARKPLGIKKSYLKRKKGKGYRGTGCCKQCGKGCGCDKCRIKKMLKKYY